MYNAKSQYTDDKVIQAVNQVVDRATGKDFDKEYYLDSFEQYFNNEADGLLRNMFIEGPEDYIESKRYRSDKDNLEKENWHLMPYINNIREYLETGEKPDWLLDEVTVNKNAYGGNLFLKGGSKNQSKAVHGKKYPSDVYRFIGEHELFSARPIKDGKRPNQRSIGFGSNNYGEAGSDARMRQILGYGWNEIDAGRVMT